jgi:general secretion pathway protein H
VERRRGNCQGFTLIELIVVLVVAGLMLALVPPLFSGALSSSELKGAARELAAALRYTRGYAVSNQKEAVLTVDTRHRRYAMAGNRRSQALPRKVNIKLVTARSERVSDSVGAVRFYPDGSATGGQITLKSGPRKYVVDINWLTGRISIFD